MSVVEPQKQIEMDEPTCSEVEDPVKTILLKEENEDIYLYSEDAELSNIQFEETDLQWLPNEFNLIEIDDDDYISGYVREEEELQNVLKIHSEVTQTTYVVSYNGRGKKRLHYYNKLMDIDSHITSVDRYRTFCCVHGPKHNPAKRVKEDFNEHHDYYKEKEKRNASGDIICPARICISDITVYKEYVVEGLSMKLKKETLSKLREAISEDESAVSREKYIHIKLPLNTCHSGHKFLKKLRVKKKKGNPRTHPSVLKKIEELTLLGIRKLNVFRPLLTAYVEESLVGSLPEGSDPACLYPSDFIIESRMQKTIRKHGLSLVRVGKHKHSSEGEKQASKVRCVIYNNGSNVIRISRSKTAD